ncbi:MAG: biotin transporter BioY [Ruminococcus sp.]|nr:biotin transporter BioY [Ruminococcus sp.]
MSQTATASHKAFTTKELVMTALMSVVIAICSWISIPIGSVPFTLQTFAVFCAMLILGGKKGTFAVLVYILLGAVGIPVFAGFTGGIGIILGTTGGYIIGFLILGLFYWLIDSVAKDDMFPKNNLIIKIAALVIGLLLCYAFGTVWFMQVYAKQADAIDIKTALEWCVIPFLIPDVIKLIIAAVVSENVRKYA